MRASGSDFNVDRTTEVVAFVGILPDDCAVAIGKDCVNRPHDGWKSGAVVIGPPPSLRALCARLGFKNECRKGRVFLTGAKMRRLAEQKAAARAAQVLP